jgi:curved DNA-binding protein CbpA
MAKRDPRDVLGVEQGASPTQIKAAWRRLARANHPDLTGDDPAASRLATRRMAEINDAYAALTRNADRPSRNGSAGGDETPFEPGAARRRGGPPAPKPTRPVTARVDMSGVYQPRNQAVGNSAGRTPLSGQPPKATNVIGREPLRASTPTGPLVRDRVRNFRRAPAPSLEVALATVMPFGKFHDHTLGQIANFEASYIDWVAGTVNHDPDLVNAARVVQADLDLRGIMRRSHVPTDRKAATRSA